MYCGKWRKISKSHCDLDLGLTMHNIELVRVIFIYYRLFKFHVPGSITFSLIVQKHGKTERQKHGSTETHAETQKRNYNNNNNNNNNIGLITEVAFYVLKHCSP